MPAPTEIKRVTFFDNQFLQQAEFQDEQRYHQYLRRRLNYALFDQSGVVQGLAVTTDSAGKQYTVGAGMAISLLDVDREGRDIILLQDLTAPLTEPTFQDGDTAIITIHYAEEDISFHNPGTGQVEVMRKREAAVVTAHNGAVPSDGNDYIVLAEVDFTSMAVDNGPRQAARINAALLTGGVTPGAPTITSISPNAGAPGDSVACQIVGTNLSGAALAVSGTGVQVSGVTVTATTIDFTLDIDPGAATGARTITVDTGTPPVATTTFQVAAAADPPVILDLDPGSAFADNPVDIKGDNLHDPALSPGDDPSDLGLTSDPVTVTLEKSGAEPLPVTGLAVKAPQEVGVAQVITATIPARPDGTWTDVTLRLSNNAGEATAPFTYLG